MDTPMNTLIHFGFQNAIVVTVLALAVWLLTRFWRNPLLGRALWLLVLVKLVPPPLWELPVSSTYFGWSPGPETKVIDLAIESPISTGTLDVASSSQWFDDGVAPGPIDVRPIGPEPTSDGTNSGVNEVADGSRPSVVAHEEESSMGVTRFAAVPQAVGPFDRVGESLNSWSRSISWPIALLVTWLVGSALLLTVFTWRLWRFSRRLRACGTEDEQMGSFVEDVAQTVGLRRVPTVRSTDATHPPLVWYAGRRPVIVLPRSLMRQLSNQEQRAILTHELLHIRRGDHLVRLFETLVLVLFWWHPVVWWARRELQRFEEQCCDADVLRLCPGSSETYATVLMKTVQFLQRECPVAVAFTSAMAHRHSLVERIERILGDSAPARWSWASRSVTFLILGLLPLTVGLGAPNPQQSSELTGRPSGVIRATTLPIDVEEPPQDDGNPTVASGAGESVKATKNTSDPAVAGSSVQFSFESPQGMIIDRETQDGQFGVNPIRVPGRLEFAAGRTYALMFGDLPGRAGLTLYATLQVAEPTPATANHLASNGVRIQLSDRDLDLIESYNFVTKVVWWPNPDRPRAEARTEMTASTRLSSGSDLVAQADHEGTVMAVLRVANFAQSPLQSELIPFDRPYGEFGFPGGLFGPHWETVRLATAKPVQDELGLTTEQRRALGPVYTSLMLKDGQWSRAGRDQPELLEEEYERTLSILNDEQLQRLSQIIFRRLGFSAFLQSKHADRFGLTDEQRQRFQLAWNEHIYRAQQGWQGSEGREAYHKLQAEAFAALSPEQRESYAALIGPPVTERTDTGRTAEVGASQVEWRTLMPEFVNEVLYWLPTDTETLVVARDFECRPLFEGEVGFPGPEELTLGRITKPRAISPLFALPAVVQEAFLGQPIDWAVSGGRDYVTVDAFGGYEFDGCSIVRFAEPIFRADDDAQKQSLVQTLRRTSSEHWRISDLDVFVFALNKDNRVSQSNPTQTGWSLGLEFSMPVGMRGQQAAVRQAKFDYELAKSLLNKDDQSKSEVEAAVDRFIASKLKLQAAEHEAESAGRFISSYQMNAFGPPAARLTMEQAKRDLQAAQEEYEFTSRLVRKGYKNQNELEAARMGVETAKLALQEAEEEEQVKRQLHADLPKAEDELYLVPLDDHRLLVATDDVYLMQTLRRMQSDDLVDRALRAASPIWGDVDVQSESWGIRVVPERTRVTERTLFTSVAWSVDRQGANLNVVHRPRSEANIEQTVRDLWLGPGHKPNPSITIEEQADRSVRATISADFVRIRDGLFPLFTMRVLPSIAF